jgi:hypothetical protein
MNRAGLIAGLFVAMMGLVTEWCYGGASRSAAWTPNSETAMEDNMQAEIVAIEHGLSPRAPKGWWLEVVWRIQNPAERPLHLLSKGPLSILDGNTVVLNHALTDHPFAVDPNVEPEMEFVIVGARDALDLRRTYPLPPIDLQAPRTVVGRFSVSYDRPDPEWCQGRVWGAVERWQQVLESLPFEVR